MIRGLYSSGWGMMALTKKMDVIASNMANADTNGYKKDRVVLESFPQALTRRINDLQASSPVIGNMELSSDVGEIHTDYGSGRFVSSNSQFDICIRDNNSISSSGAAFFTVSVPVENGEYKEYYTKAGSFTLDNIGRLVTKEGHLVMGEYGQILLEGENFTVEEDGTLLIDGEFYDKLLIREFDNPETLRKAGDNLVFKTGETNETQFTGKILQGCVEKSNVNIIREMVDMISVMRAYEANQKMIQAQDSTLEKVVNEVGAVR